VMRRLLDAFLGITKWIEYKSRRLGLVVGNTRVRQTSKTKESRQRAAKREVEALVFALYSHSLLTSLLVQHGGQRLFSGSCIRGFCQRSSLTRSQVLSRLLSHPLFIHRALRASLSFVSNPRTLSPLSPPSLVTSHHDTAWSFKYNSRHISTTTTIACQYTTASKSGSHRDVFPDTDPSRRDRKRDSLSTKHLRDHLHHI
jgi:hypothetical protein